MSDSDASTPRRGGVIVRVAQAGLVALVRGGRAARDPERRPLRLCRRPAGDQRARRLQAEHDHPPLRPRRAGDRRVRHRATGGDRYDDMSPFLRHAIIATEDADFEQHFGLSATRILVTLVNDVIKGETAGASTITQQLARNLFLRLHAGASRRRTRLERKIKEAIIAIQLEQRYTKREIFTSTPTRSSSGTARTASKRRRGCTSTSRRRSWRSRKARCWRRSSRRLRG